MSSGWRFDALHVPGVLNDVADGISRWKNPKYTLIILSRARPHPMAGLAFEGKWQSSLYLGVGLELVQNAVAPLTERVYQGCFGSLVEFCFERDMRTGVL